MSVWSFQDDADDLAKWYDNEGRRPKPLCGVFTRIRDP